MCAKYCIVGNFEGRNFCKFHHFVAIHESFLCESWGCRILWCSKSEQSAKVFSAKIHQFTKVFESFRKFPAIQYAHYTLADVDRSYMVVYFTSCRLSEAICTCDPDQE